MFGHVLGIELVWEFSVHSYYKFGTLKKEMAGLFMYG